MSSIESKSTGISLDLLAEMEEAARIAMTNVRDPEVMRQACDRMDKNREEIRRKHGLLDIAVPAIRELRGKLPD